MPYLKRISLFSETIKKTFIRLFVPLVIIVSAVNCNRDMFDPDPHALPGFSTDTMTFDTVFTTIGSTTLNFKVYNKSNRPLIINSISLAGGDGSFFRLNIDGVPATLLTRVEVPPDDSLFVFVAVTVDPTNQNNPVVIRDSILFTTNGRLQDVKLIAYGQDVHLINGKIIGTQIWENDKPYLIYNSMAVDTGQILTIQAGTRIYFHQNSSMIIWGTIQVQGTWENPVIFRNDRLEKFYDVVSGQWGTLYIDPISTGNKIDHAVITNSIAGIQIGYPSGFSVPELELSNSMIMNVSFAGIYAFGANITCYNTVIANTAGPAAALLRGGSYRFQHCTISNNGVIGASRSTPSVLISNTFTNQEYDPGRNEYVYVNYKADLENAEFSNSIIYGTYNHEILLSNNHSNLFNFTFDHCLMKIVQDSIQGDLSVNFKSLIINKNPEFKNDSDRYHLDYSLDTLSPAKDAGDVQLLLTYPYLEQDITGSSRTLYGLPDLGAFERKEE